MVEVEWSLDRDKINRALEDAMTKLGRRARLQRSLDKPVRERTALDAANCAVARLIEDGTFV